MKITIARQCGSGGHEVAEALAEKLNLEIFDKKRFVEEAKKRNVYDENANFLNEKPIDSFLYSIAMSYGATNPRDRYIDFVKELTEQENCIIIGRCANYIYRDDKDCVSVYLHADREIRCERLQKRDQISEKEALKIFRKWMRNVLHSRNSVHLPDGAMGMNTIFASIPEKLGLKMRWR